MSISNRRAASKDLFTPTAKAADRLTFQDYKAINRVPSITSPRTTQAGFRRATHYMHPVLLHAISAYAYENDVDKSYVVREALNAFLGEEYLHKGLAKYNEKTLG